MKKNLIIGITLFLITISSLAIIHNYKGKKNKDIKTKSMEAMVLSKSNSKLTIQDEKNIIYTISTKDINADIGSNILIEYSGLLNKNKQMQNVSVINYKTIPTANDNEKNTVPNVWKDEGIFSTFYLLANDKLKSLTLDEKIGQLFLVRYPDSNAIEDLKKYNFAGFVFFEKDFKNKTETEVKNWINSLQTATKIPLLTAVDEEGGKVVRISSNPNLVSQKFKSPQQLYNEGGFNLIKQDTIDKSAILKNLGLNLNLAPVVDVSTNSSDYMYERTLGENTTLTSTYAKTVIEASKNTDVSYTLKHFPGYGNNKDTHNGSVTDNRTYQDIKDNDLPPFEAGINAGAEAILVSHNIVSSIDNNNPASLSPSVHNLLRNNMNFTGIIMTDDLDMGALSSISDPTLKAILAGNDLIITTDYKASIESVKNAIQNGTISEELIDKLAFRVLAWKYYKGLMYEVHK